MPTPTNASLLQDVLLKLDRLEHDLTHVKQLLESRLDHLDTCSSDHEARLRDIEETVAQVKVSSGLTGMGSSLISIAAFIKALIS